MWSILLKKYALLNDFFIFPEHIFKLTVLNLTSNDCTFYLDWVSTKALTALMSESLCPLAGDRCSAVTMSSRCQRSVLNDIRSSAGLSIATMCWAAVPTRSCIATAKKRKPSRSCGAGCEWSEKAAA